MSALHSFFDIFLHLDEHLATWIQAYHNWIYIFLFAIIFIETGIVIWPWLPGDSLLFAAGSFAAGGSLNIFLVVVPCFIAAVLGNTSNYFIGKLFGERILSRKFRGKPLVKKEQLDKTHRFYEKYGPVTLIITRFMPIIRTIAPFVAGIGEMTTSRFTLYNIAGALLWVPVMSLLGYFFGQTAFVQAHFEWVAVGIIVLSLIPVGIGLFGRRAGKRKHPVDTA